MSRWTWGVAALLIALGACTDTDLVVNPGPTGSGGDVPAPPRDLNAWYFNRAVNVTWELDPAWDEDSFRVYSKRLSDPDHFLIAEVTSCSGGLCSYVDVNIVAGVTYNYFVTAVDPVSGNETASETSVNVSVPQPIPPPVPGALEVVALDGSNYIRWDAAARDAGDFSFYRVYQIQDGTNFLLGETDSEGFLDELASNGATFTYVVTSVDDQGHESQTSGSASGTPRPDYHGEVIFAFQDVPGSSGFVFQTDESSSPIVDGSGTAWDLRLEIDAEGWLLVPGPAAEIHPDGVATTALKCGPGSDADCFSLDVAPATGYGTAAVSLETRTTYAVRLADSDGTRFGAVRVELLGFDQNGDALMIFDWALQLQTDNRSLTTPAGVVAAP